MLLDQVLQRDTHLLLDHAWVVYVSRNAEELGALVSGAAKGGEPGAAATADSGCDGDGLDVGHRCGATEEADVGGEGRL